MKKKYLHQQNLEKWLKFEISKGRFMLENKKKKIFLALPLNPSKYS
jgi:heat shock protein HslJ